MGVFGTYLKLEDFKSPEKAGGEEVRIPLKNEAKIKIKQPLRKDGGGQSLTIQKWQTNRSAGVTGVRLESAANPA